MKIKKALTIEIVGRVQAVGFRHFVKENAETIGITGTVKNNDDGSVSIQAYGEQEQLEAFLRTLQIGSFLSKVEGMSYKWQEKSKIPKTFNVIHDKGLIEDQTRNFINLGKRFLKIKPKIPVHVAIIPDGNRRWATANGLKKIEGHKHSAQIPSLLNLFEESRKLGIKYLTFWAFSTENWKREKHEVDYLFSLILSAFKELQEYAIEHKVRFRHIGRKDRLPPQVLKAFNETEEITKNFDAMNIQICLDYGGRDELIRAVNKLLKSGISEIHENDIAHALDSAGIPDPDLIIRTSGEYRMSGFMPFQSTYSEYYFTDTHFPDFGPKQLKQAVTEFGQRGRRFGGL